jgi:hypothetical protein
MKTTFEPPKSVFDRHEKATHAFIKASTAAHRAQVKARDAEQEKCAEPTAVKKNPNLRSAC